MAKGIREVTVARDLEPASLSELIHQQVRGALQPLLKSASFEERRVARDRHSERGSGGMANALTG